MPDADNDCLARVKSALTSLTRSDDAALLLAVSGGPDSMAMLDLVKRCWAGPVSAATVDHGLRPESAAEADMVAGHCASIGVPHTILKPAVPITGNLQSAARVARYRLLADEADRNAAPWIVTAHHADDQLETMLMRLARGSGVDGLAGVRARNGRVVRPLLGFGKAELQGYCTAHAIPFVEDPSNRNVDFDRVRMRNALATFDVIGALQAVKSAQALADAADALEWIAAREAETAIGAGERAAELHRTDYPAALLRRLVLLCLERIEPGIAPRGAALDRLIGTLQSGGQAMVGNVLCHGGEIWRFVPAPARNNAPSPGHSSQFTTDNP